MGSCREGGDRGSDNNEGDHEHQQALLDDRDDQGEGEGSSSHAHGKEKEENKGDKQESKVGAVESVLPVSVPVPCVVVMLCIGACWMHLLLTLLRQTF